MVKKILALLLISIGSSNLVVAQELYVFSEPASNMGAKSLGIRVTTEGNFTPKLSNRIIPEVMIGFNKHLMTHVQLFASDYRGKYEVEGASLYAKYRFLSIDEVKSHFRAAAFARISTHKGLTYTEDINLEGDNSGWQSGLVFTQLMHKLALSGTVGYSQVFKDASKVAVGTRAPHQIINYSLSSGYLLLPFVYKNYNQPNFNLYFEVLGKTNPANGNSALDFAPALQVILNSRTRVDLGYRFNVAGNIDNRHSKNMYLARLELNFFNAFK